MRLLRFLPLFLGLAVTALAAEDVSRPNVVFILTDDMGWGDLGVHGNPRVLTPNIDRLHAQSVRFIDHHVSTICSPTRGELMTGIDAYRNGASSAISGYTMVRRGLPLMPEYFRDYGYATAHFGKWHLGDNYPYHPQDRGFDVSYHYSSFGLNSIAGHWQNCAFDDIGWRNYSPASFPGYTTDYLFGEAMRWMREQRKPFLVYLAPLAAKKPLYVPSRYVKPYDDLDKMLAEYYGMIANLDENMGRLLRFLDENGLGRDTIVVYMHDNGPDGYPGYYDAGLRGLSGSLYDGGHKAPFFVRWPAGLKGPPRDIDVLTHGTDLLPTLLDLCGLRVVPPTAFDGRSLKPLLDGASDPDPDRKVVIQYGTEFKAWDSAVLWRKWRLVGGKELYDVATDPGERRDLASARPEIVQALRRHYERWMAATLPLLEPEKYVLLGSAVEPVTRLTSDEWYGTRASSWKYLAVTSEPVVGYWKVESVVTARYEVALHLFPPEAGARVDQGLRNVPARPVAEARLLLDGRECGRLPAAGATRVLFTLPLRQGERHRLEGQFLDAQGRTLCGAFFTLVRRLND